jgi:GNAT superfamily N-acetyltransferase
VKVCTPLDREGLNSIPTACEGKFYIGGPYELFELLQEPEQYGDEGIDWRDIQISGGIGVKTGSARIEVASGFCKMNSCVWPGQEARITQKLRYLYRENPNAIIEGAVTVEISYLLPGVSRRFAVQRESVIHSIYVNPSSRGRGIARILLAEVLDDAPNVKVHPQFSEDGARLFGFDKSGKRNIPGR